MLTWNIPNPLPLRKMSIYNYFHPILVQYSIQGRKLLCLLKTCTCLHGTVVIDLSLNMDTLNFQVSIFISWSECLSSLLNQSSMRICNLLPSHAGNTIKISLKELSFGLIDKYYAQKEPLKPYNGYSTNSRISPSAEMHYVLISSTLGPHCVKNCNLTKLQRITGSFCPRVPAISKYDQKVTGNFQKWNNPRRRKLSAFMC